MRLVRLSFARRWSGGKQPAGRRDWLHRKIRKAQEHAGQTGRTYLEQRALSLLNPGDKNSNDDDATRSLMKHKRLSLRMYLVLILPLWVYHTYLIRNYVPYYQPRGGARARARFS